MKNKKDLSILVLSCDKHNDLWYPFFKLKNKYWQDCPCETYISTESLKCEYCKTINVDTEIWTKRIRESLKQIDSEFVLIMCEDYFIRDKVDQKRIDTLFNNFKHDTATFNFELSYSQDDLESEYLGWKLRPEGSKYRLSCQAGIWNKDILIELLENDLDPWSWERQIPDNKYKYYINSGNLIINYGFYKYGQVFGVYRGKWSYEVVPFFEKEGIDIDYTKRGFHE